MTHKVSHHKSQSQKITMIFHSIDIRLYFGCNKHGQTLRLFASQRNNFAKPLKTSEPCDGRKLKKKCLVK